MPKHRKDGTTYTSVLTSGRDDHDPSPEEIAEQAARIKRENLERVRGQRIIRIRHAREKRP